MDNCGENSEHEWPRDSDFVVFDTLPKELRDKLNQAVYKYSAQQAHQILQRFGLKNALKIIDRTDKDLLQDHGTQTPHHKT